MAKRQATLFSVLSSKRRRVSDCECEEVVPDETAMTNELSGSEELVDEETNEADSQIASETMDTTTGCSPQCCSSEEKAFQPSDKPSIQLLSSKNRSFQSSWYKKFPWLSVCIQRKKVFCFYCRYAVKRNWLTFSKNSEKIFTEKGFQNWKKAIEKFKAHEGSLSHKEANVKWIAQGRPTIGSQISSQVKKLQQTRRAGLICQLRGIQYLARQGIAFQGHTELEGNLKQQLLTWSLEIEDLRIWVKENRFTCHQTVNELISIMGQTLLRDLLEKIQKGNPAWFSVIADEATDVCNAEQLNLSIRWVNSKYEVFEDTVGLFRVPNTRAETLFTVIKDLLTRCNLPLSLCRGQAYDGAANMQGKRSGVAARLLSENPAAIPVHCFAHSLNLCLQGVGKNVVCIRDALEIVKEIGKLIKLSPKRFHLFSTKLQQASDSGVSLKVAIASNEMDMSNSSNRCYSQRLWCAIRSFGRDS
jgi:hypothetical protein